MKFPPKPSDPRRRADSRTVLVLLAVVGLQVVIVLVIVAVAFPDWRPAFLRDASQEAAMPDRLVAPGLPNAEAPGDATRPVAPTDTAASRMLFGGPGSAVLGDHVPAPPPRPAPERSASIPNLPTPRSETDTPNATEQTAFQRYLDWLRAVELERLSLRTWGEHHLSAGEPATPSEPAQRRQVLHLAGQEVRAFRQRILRTRPVVPPECRIVDQYYMGALSQEASQTIDLLEAMEQQDVDQTRQFQRLGTGRVDRDLTVANAKLEQTLRKHGQPPALRIEMGAGASLLGALAE